MTVTTRIVAACIVCAAWAMPSAAQTPPDAHTEARRVPKRTLILQAQAQAPRRRAPAAPRRPNTPTVDVAERFSQTVTLDRGATFELHNTAGDIIVTGGGGSTARIDAVKRVRAVSEAAARAMLDGIQIEIAERGGHVQVRTLHPRVNVIAVDYTVTLPSNASVILRSGSGHLQVRKVDGEVRAQSETGNLTAVDAKRLRQLRSISGNIEVIDSESDEFNVNTSLGNVVVRKLRGRLLDFRTVTGNMLLQEIAAERALLQSTNGDLEFAGRLTRSGRYQFQTHRGNIRVIPSGNPGFDLEATTFSGDLRSDFQLDGAEPLQSQSVKTLRGTSGNAGALITATSFSGNIVIMKP